MKKPNIKKLIRISKEVIEDGVSGYTIPPFDTEAFAEKTLQLLEDGKTLETMKKTARKWAEEHFSIKEMARRYHQQFQQLAATKET